ncbi:MAG TPA: VTT domain-containing protein [Vicinamibacterales bacterium]|nr:VTT domain-containing protein [Vicinamibacterales bacterium]
MIHAFVHFFVSLPGVIVLAALDSTFFFTLPLGIDAVVVLLASRRGMFFWLTPAFAIAGSLAGAAFTYWTGTTIGEAGLKHFCSPKALGRIKKRLKGSAITLAALDLLPPPFPFSVFVLGAGAAKVDRRKFFVTLALCRLLRFGTEAVLGLRYGRYALRWIESDMVERIVAVVVLLAIAAGVFSLRRLRHRPKSTEKPSTAGGKRPGARSPRKNPFRVFSPSSR